jgi:hypothetical protein
MSTIAQLQTEIKRLHGGFHYKNDGASALFDAMNTPPQCLASLEAGNLTDDCDGYHAAIYELVLQRVPRAKNVRLLTVTTQPFWKSHTMCAFDLGDKSYLVNYQEIVPIANDAAAADYFAKHDNVTTTGVVANQWDAEKGWHAV